MALVVENLPANAGDLRHRLILGGEDPLKEGRETPCSILAWRISMDKGARRATVRGVAKSQTQLKQLTHTMTFETSSFPGGKGG